jgi:ABC-type transport system involved in multi-copper enzyme maturation permease subunit
LAVYDRRYRAYEGPITPLATRWRVLPRYAWSQIFHSRLFVAFYTLCFVYPVFLAGWIYLLHNLSALNALHIDALRLAPVDARAFATFMGVQCFLFGGVMALLVGPGLVSPDLANGALPLYLGRPLTRRSYALGKMGALIALESSITWIPGVLLFLFQSWLDGWGWLVENFHVAVAIVAGAWIWIATITLLSLATSSVAKRKVVAQTFLLGALIFGSVAGQSINVMFGTRLGFVFNVPELMHTVWEGLYRVPLHAQLPTSVAWGALCGICGISIAVVSRRLRAFEVVR